MGCQFIVRSQGHMRHLELKTVVYDGIQIVRSREDGIAVFEVVDPDAVMELIVRRQSSIDAAVAAAAAGLRGERNGACRPTNSCHAEDPKPANVFKSATVAAVPAPPTSPSKKRFEDQSENDYTPDFIGGGGLLTQNDMPPNAFADLSDKPANVSKPVTVTAGPAPHTSPDKKSLKDQNEDDSFPDFDFSDGGELLTNDMPQNAVADSDFGSDKLSDNNADTDKQNITAVTGGKSDSIGDRLSNRNSDNDEQNATSVYGGDPMDCTDCLPKPDSESILKERSSTTDSAEDNLNDCTTQPDEKNVSKSDASGDKLSDNSGTNEQNITAVSGVSPKDRTGCSPKPNYDSISKEKSTATSNLNDSTTQTDVQNVTTKVSPKPKYFSQAVAASALTSLAEKETSPKKESVHDIKWNKQYNELLAFKLEHGHLNVSREVNRTLQVWIKTQWKNFKNGSLVERRAVKLRDVGLLSADEYNGYTRTKAESKYEERMRTNWESRYNDLVAYKREHGTCDVTLTIDLPLSRWVCSQRKEFKKGNMSAERIAKLDAIGMLDKVREEKKGHVNSNEPSLDTLWNMRYDELVAYKREHGHCDVTQRENRVLGNWRYSQLSNYREGKLSDERVARLQELGFTFVSKSKADEWNEHYSDLKQFMHENGHCNIPLNYEPSPRLLNWVNRARTNFKKLTVQQVDMLNEIGFVWEDTSKPEYSRKRYLEALWNKRYNELVDFKQEHGHCKVPKSTHPQLANWAGGQAAKFREGKLSDNHVAKLNEINFELLAHSKKDKWNKRFSELKLFMEEHGHCDVPPEYESAPHLHDWVDRMRMRFSSGKLRTDYVVKLNEIAFAWEEQNNPSEASKITTELDKIQKLTKVLEREMQPNSSRDYRVDFRWVQHYEELAAYKREHGHCKVCSTTHPQLANWTGNQLRKYRQGELSNYCATKLNELGFQSNLNPLTPTATKVEWNTRYSALKLFIQKHGHSNIPLQYEPQNLANWVKNMRITKRSGNLSVECIDKLNQIGFVWEIPDSDEDEHDPANENSHKSRWDLRYKELVAFKRKHGHCTVYSSSRSLAKWTHDQRKKFRQGELSDEHITKLNAVGFGLTSIWDTRYSELKCFMQEHGHCNVPLKYKSSPHLRHWISNVRASFKSGKLVMDQVEKLNEIGFNWETPNMDANENRTSREKDFEARWNRHYSKLVAFKREHGHCKVSKSLDSELATWAHKQAVRFRKGKLSDEQVARLNELGFTWSHRDEVWETRFSELKLFIQEHGHHDFPSKHQLDNWIRRQKINLKSGLLSAERVERLKAIGLVLDEFDVDPCANANGTSSSEGKDIA